MGELIQIIKWAAVILVGIVVIVSIIVISVNAITKKRKKKMHMAVEAILERIVAREPATSSLEKVFCEDYDYIYTNSNRKVYIMIVPNTGNDEICVNSATMWQLRKTAMDNTTRFVPRIDRLMRFDPPMAEGKKNAKLYIIYPSAKSMLRYINECEMEFVKYKTDINGAHLVTFNELHERMDKIQL